MTTAMSLDGPWTGLRAFPRGFRTPDSRERMEAALQRLQDHRERFDRHIARAQAAVERIDRIVADGIARLDASDPDADLEPDGSDEPSLCGIQVGGAFMSSDDREHSADDVGEPSLGSGPSIDQTGGKWLSGCNPSDVEDEHDGREAEEDHDKSDYEPDQDESCAWADEGDQTTLTVRPVYVAPPRVERTGRLTGDCALNLAPAQRPLASLPPGWVRISGPALPTFSDGKWNL